MKSTTLTEKNNALVYAERISMLAKLLRQHEGITQCKKKVCISETQVCATGLLGLHAGILPSDLKKFTGNELKIFKLYGISDNRLDYLIPIPYKSLLRRKDNIPRAIVMLNDKGYTFDQIADFLDESAKYIVINYNKLK